ncbi:MAG: 2-oxoacid:acceptor oxidoreductase family protein [Planctomycetes bacterium]|nr:2-oxoacid:acceptor oxidoreductase family protein [Planctomycetota bacterium]
MANSEMNADISTADEHRIIIAGFGGQGVLTLGKLLCTACMDEGKAVTYLPSYGSEVRGGTANCHVVVSPQQIFSPLVENADSLIVMNAPSFERFSDSLKPGGLMILNTSLVNPGTYADDRELVFLPIEASERATNLGNVLVTNVIMLGAFLALSGLCPVTRVQDAIRQLMSGRKSKNIDINLSALDEGIETAREAFPQRAAE